MSSTYMSARDTPEPRDTDSLMASNSQSMELKVGVIDGAGAKRTIGPLGKQHFSNRNPSGLESLNVVIGGKSSSVRILFTWDWFSCDSEAEV